MPNDNPIINTDIIANTDAVIKTNVANPSQVVLGNKNEKTGSYAKSVFAYDMNDPEIAPFSKHLARSYYPGSKLIPIKSVKDLASKLSKYTTIDTLVIFIHSSPEYLIINGDDKNSKYVNKELAKANVVITSRIVFEGCNKMRDPIDTCKMIASIAGPSVKVVGYNYYGIIQIIDFDFSGINDSESVKTQYNDFINKYWLPGLPTPNNALGKKFSHGRRWFRNVNSETFPEEMLNSRIDSLTSLGRVTAKNYNEAEDLRQSYTAPSFLGDIITVSNVSNIAEGKP